MRSRLLVLLVPGCGASPQLNASELPAKVALARASRVGGPARRAGAHLHQPAPLRFIEAGRFEPTLDQDFDVGTDNGCAGCHQPGLDFVLTRPTGLRDGGT